MRDRSIGLTKKVPSLHRAFKEGLLGGNGSLASAIFAYTDSVRK